MNSIKTFILFLAITTIFCHFELENSYDEEGDFLKMLTTQGGSPVELSSCLDNPTFIILNKKVDPTEIMKGQSIKIKVLGQMKEQTTVQKLHLVTLYNDGVIFEDNVDKKNEVVPKGGKYIYEYEASVPTFTPAGEWNIYLYLVNSENVNVSCLKAHFSMN